MYQRNNIVEVQDLLWDYYQQLKHYQLEPSSLDKTILEQAFEQLFGRCYLHHGTLNTVLKGFREHKAQLLLVLEYPQLPLHNNDAETDIRGAAA
ncbi:transposase [Synechococcales cyanobacterium C]|uniref:Transposase n=1 Tax=Petrachloros mirabilis ULC683 TaxID=2781853 RepID=A0A8K2A829_9CYAN|nr:transposase [Petrachloros mirabilis]NCJ06560.1 transposase [Petrachloros mirabilis ULC683]